MCRVYEGVDVVRFGTFEARLGSAELYKQGRLVRLQLQPFIVLQTLLQHPGELVTREEFRKQLWPDGVTVDFDQSLNKSVTKLRDALGDTAANPRFIETLPKRGYRFIAPLTPDGATATVQLARPRARSAGRALWRTVALVGVLATAAGAFIATTHQQSIAQARVSNSTSRSTPGTQSPIVAARDAYERGRLALARRSHESLRLGVEHFARAVALSPRYADAYVGLSDGWHLMSSYGLIDPREGMPRARDAANRALALNPGMARAHASLGRIAMIFDWDWTAARWHFARAAELERGHGTTHQWFAYFLSATGQHDEAVEEARRAVVAEPLSLNTNTALGYVLYLARRYEDAAIQLERTLEIDPDFAQARRDLALVRMQQGRQREAVAALQRVATLNQQSPVAVAELAWAHGRAGDKEIARTLLADLDRMRESSYVPPDSLALVHVGLGTHDEAIAWLQRALTIRVATLAHLPVEPVWDPLGGDSRLAAMVTTIRGSLESPAIRR